MITSRLGNYIRDMRINLMETSNDSDQHIDQNSMSTTQPAQSIFIKNKTTHNRVYNTWLEQFRELSITNKVILVSWFILILTLLWLLLASDNSVM